STITLTNSFGTIQRWQWSQNGTNWVDLIGSEGLYELLTGNLTEPTFYRAVVQSGNCLPEYSTVASVAVDPPACTLTVIPSGSTVIDCASGTTTITVVASGGTPPYLYSLDGVTFQLDQNFSGVVPGSYIVTVKDVSGCIGTKSVSVSQSTHLTVE